MRGIFNFPWSNKIEKTNSEIIEFPDKKIIIQPVIITILDKHRCAIRYNSKKQFVEIECQLFAEQFNDIAQYHALRDFYFNNPIQGNIESFMLLLKRKIESTNFSKNPKNKITALLTEYQQLKQKYDENAA